MTDLSARTLLVPYLFIRTEGSRRHWYGVSAYSLEDAIALLHASGYALDPHDSAVSVRENVVLDDYERRHMEPSMGPMQFRGVWYPRHNLGGGLGKGRAHDQAT
jgi:hypothetical protein